VIFWEKDEIEKVIIKKNNINKCFAIIGFFLFKCTANASFYLLNKL